MPETKNSAKSSTLITTKVSSLSRKQRRLRIFILQPSICGLLHYQRTVRRILSIASASGYPLMALTLLAHTGQDVICCCAILRACSIRRRWHPCPRKNRNIPPAASCRPFGVLFLPSRAHRALVKPTPALG